jgi:hypothetical protein
LSVIIRSGKKIARRLLNLAAPSWHRVVDTRSLRHERPRQAGDFHWRPIRRCVEPRLDSGGATIGSRLYVTGGYQSPDHVLNIVDILDMTSGRWIGRWPTPPQMAQTHEAVACDGERFIYFVSGQLGNHCRSATPSAFVLDTTTMQFHDLPPLPRARYAPTAQLWNGRLHVVCGSREDRCTPSTDHWSLAVRNGRADDREWRVEPSIPVGGPHRASAVVDGRLFVFGGQIGDWIAVPGDPECRCTGENIREQYLSSCFALSAGSPEWTTVSPMLQAVSHTESATFVLGSAVYLLGGQCAIDSSDEMGLTAAIQKYDARRDAWSIVGTLPYRVKTCVTGHHDGWIYIVGGQRDRGAADARPGRFVNRAWRARLPSAAT